MNSNNNSNSIRYPLPRTTTIWKFIRIQRMNQIHREMRKFNEYYDYKQTKAFQLWKIFISLHGEE